MILGCLGMLKPKKIHAWVAKGINLAVWKAPQSTGPLKCLYGLPLVSFSARSQKRSGTALGGVPLWPLPSSHAGRKKNTNGNPVFGARKQKPCGAPRHRGEATVGQTVTASVFSSRNRLYGLPLISAREAGRGHLGQLSVTAICRAPAAVLGGGGNEVVRERVEIPIQDGTRVTWSHDQVGSLFLGI